LAARKTTRRRSNQRNAGSSKPTTMRLTGALLDRLDRMAASSKYNVTRTWLVAKYLEEGLARDGDKVVVVEKVGAFA
jgi:hypothetical protein